MYHDILITTDGSDGTKRAIRHGLEVAERDGATVHLLYVKDDMIRRRAFSLKSLRQLTDDEREQAEEAIHELRSVADEYDVDVVSNIRSCAPYVLRDTFHRTIVDYVAQNEIDLVVMGIQERTGFRRLVKGSVTHRVVTNTDVPVLARRIPLPDAGGRSAPRTPDPAPETD